MTDRPVRDPKAPVGRDRRSGLDRRRADAGPASGRDRRISVEPRKPDVLELHVSVEEWNALKAQAEARHAQAAQAAQADSRRAPGAAPKPAA